MKNKTFLAAILLLILPVTLMWAEGHSEEKEKVFTDKDATTAFDAFNATFYNPEMKLYAISSDMNGRAAIWVQAIYWDMAMNAYKRTQAPKYRKLIEDIYQGGYEQYDKYNWNNKVEWFIYDDMMWWIISLARAYEITGEPKYLANASAGFFKVWADSYDAQQGGLWWNFAHDAKMSCINYPTIVGAMTLYNITKDPDYLDKAKNIYAWSRNVFFDKEKGRIADNMHYHFQRQNGMDVNWTTQLYNQATFIGSAVMLYKETKDKSYLKDAILAADYVRNVMCDNNGILPFKNGVEQGIYTAIFAQYIIRLIEDGNQPQYLDWLRYNINKAWGNRDVNRNVTFKDAAKPCPTGTVESYDASGCPALMQLISPLKR
ncbi:glycoside hydrolase family 76 protein [uncultured Bacteroides sp.]|uniref:glycoside hydrolase family 76 protein n=1 Tax=uncultured Bacteroides sp. TaxID=162156 RepID=UPI002AA6364F|nr:glycoside hydrolase family 76 protein [uncultured Bacteroides sp.]